MGSLLATAAFSTTVSPYWTQVAPEACLATFPTSMDRVRPPSSTLTDSGIRFSSLKLHDSERHRAPWRAMGQAGRLGSVLGRNYGEVPLAREELLAEAKLLDHQPVALDLRRFQIIEQPTSLTYHPEQPSATVMVALVDLEMLRQVLDSFGEKRD